MNLKKKRCLSAKWFWVPVIGLVAGLFGVASWTLWAETHPSKERDLRIAMRDQLEAWFPEEMEPLPGEYGWLRHQEGEGGARATVVLVHGLDEPGDIWDDFLAALVGEPFAVWEFRYPNDQEIDRSAVFLAEQWSQLPDARPVILIGHSMGGLVVREFVSAWRHPIARDPVVRGAVVRSVYLVGTPNHGSEWARLRSWLEIKDHFLSENDRKFSLFAALRDGVGTAKIDLRPGSDFLNTLNARPWPESVELRLIAGVMLDDARMKMGIDALAERAPHGASAESRQTWWNSIRTDLGDGVVTIESITLVGFDPPLVLPASHRGLLRRSVLEVGEPPAIPVLLEWLRASVRE